MVSRKVGKLRTKNEKGQDSSQPFPERSLMRGCLSPAHGMHTGMKPDPMTWGHPSKVAGDIPFDQQQSPPHSRGGAIVIELASC